MRSTLAADHVGSCHPRSTTPVENGRGWPARTHPNEQRVSFDNATWHSDTVLRMHRQAVPAPWATPGAVPSFFAQKTFARTLQQCLSSGNKRYKGRQHDFFFDSTPKLFLLLEIAFDLR